MKNKLPFRLRRKPRKELYDPDVCSAQGCQNIPEVTDATKNYSEYDLHFCEKHWKERK